MTDPALVDREAVYLGPISPRVLPKRGMHIPGLNGPADATILSKAASGATTRLVTIPAGWGNEQPGAFTAEVEMLLISGSLTVGRTEIVSHSLLTIKDGKHLPSISCESGATVLLSTSAPIRYEESDGSGDGAVVLSASDRDWVMEDNGMLVKTLDGPTPVKTRIVFAGHTTTDRWRQLSGWSERLVIHGEWREHAIGGDENPVMQTIRPMAYVSRPAGTRFDGPGAGTNTTALLIDRFVGAWPSDTD